MATSEILLWIKLGISAIGVFKNELANLIRSAKKSFLNSKGGTTAKCADRTQATNERREKLPRKWQVILYVEYADSNPTKE